MVRNPRAESNFNGSWSSNDTKSWNHKTISQVPFGINPLKTETDHPGIFFVEFSFVSKCFSEMSITHFRDNEGFISSWYDVVEDTSGGHSFYFDMEE